MQNKQALTRRGFLQSTGALSGSLFMRLGPVAVAAISQAACSAKNSATEYAALSYDDGRDFAAIAARIIPTTDTVGATEAGVIHFFDQAFAADMSNSLSYAVEGLGVLNASIGRRFADLAPADQDAALRDIENGEFFDFVRTITVFGFFSMSKYGGNKDHVAWNLIGFDGHHGPWEYPFGYYDAEAAREAQDGE